jgi:hypothetical protein
MQRNGGNQLQGGGARTPQASSGSWVGGFGSCALSRGRKRGNGPKGAPMADAMQRREKVSCPRNVILMDNNACALLL